MESSVYSPISSVVISYSYDDVIIPQELIGIHYKKAITARNRWMIENSDIVIGYTIRDYGGAYSALKYSERLKKKIFNQINNNEMN